MTNANRVVAARDPINEFLTASITVMTTETPLHVGAGNLNDRKQLIIINDSSNLCFLSDEPTFTIAQSKLTIYSGEVIIMDFTDLTGKTWYAKTDELTTAIRIAEVK